MILVVALTYGLFRVYKNRTNPISNLKTDNLITKEISYGPNSKNYYILKYNSDNVQNKNINLAILVHGGGFIGGSAEQMVNSSLANFFLDKDYVVASLGYRLCPDVIWPKPVEDVVSGANNLISKLQTQGLNLNKIIYAGASAGAMAGALSLYSGDYPSINNIDGFIGISGPYSPDGQTNFSAASSEKCQFNPINRLSYDGKMKVPAFISECNCDQADKYPGTKDSHLEYLANILTKSKINVVKQSVVAQDNSCSHGCEEKIIPDRNSDYMKNLDSFLNSI